MYSTIYFVLYIHCALFFNYKLYNNLTTPFCHTYIFGFYIWNPTLTNTNPPPSDFYLLPSFPWLLCHPLYLTSIFHFHSPLLYSNSIFFTKSVYIIIFIFLEHTTFISLVNFHYNDTNFSCF